MKRSTFIKAFGLIPLFSFSNLKGVKQNKVVVFTPEMITKNNFGLYIINNKANVFKNHDYAATVAWKLGYINKYWKSYDGNCGIFQKYGKVNFLTDGWFCSMGDTYEEVCNYLNNNPHGEKFRIMTKEELFYIINHRSNSKQLFYEY